MLEGDQRLGTLCLKSDLSAIYEKFRLYAAIVVLLILVSWLVAFAVSVVLQRRICRPILVRHDPFSCFVLIDQDMIRRFVFCAFENTQFLKPDAVMISWLYEYDIQKR